VNPAVQLGLVLTLTLGLLADVPRFARTRSPEPSTAQIPSGETVSVLPELPQSKDAGAAGAKKSEPIETRKEKLSERARLEIIRYVHGEFAKARRPIPGGKEGFRYIPWKELPEPEVRKAMASYGVAANPGDQVQITLVQFKGSELIVDINGGGKVRKSFRDRIQISAGGAMPQAQVQQTGGPGGSQGQGSTLILEFGRSLPDMSSAEVKQFLSPFLDFGGQRSSTTAWVDTLPPEFQQAIKDRKAVVGMDKEMVIAALGRPERKVRERDDEGYETEDWIYGNPPGKTIFVKFAGDKVMTVREFPH